MNGQTVRDWWSKWGVLIAAGLFLLALLSRLESCTSVKVTEGQRLTATEDRITATEKRLDANDRIWEEHGQVSKSRIAQLDSLDKLTALLQAQGVRTDADVQEMKIDIREIRNLLRYRSGGRP